MQIERLELTYFSLKRPQVKSVCMCVYINTAIEIDIEGEEEQRKVDNQQSERGIHIASIISNDFQHVNFYMTLYLLCETKMNELHNLLRIDCIVEKRYITLGNSNF